VSGKGLKLFMNETRLRAAGKGRGRMKPPGGREEKINFSLQQEERAI